MTIGQFVFDETNRNPVSVPLDLSSIPENFLPAGMEVTAGCLETKMYDPETDSYFNPNSVAFSLTQGNIVALQRVPSQMLEDLPALQAVLRRALAHDDTAKVL